MVHEQQEAQTLFHDDGRQVVMLSSYCGYYLGKTGDFLLTMAALGNDLVVLHSFKSADLYSDEVPSLTAAKAAQIELSYQDMDNLIASYQSYRKAHPEQAAFVHLLLRLTHF